MFLLNMSLPQNTFWPELSKLIMSVLINAESDNIFCFDIKKDLCASNTICVGGITGKILGPALYLNPNTKSLTSSACLPPSHPTSNKVKNI